MQKNLTDDVILIEAHKQNETATRSLNKRVETGIN